ncbi:MAG: hypothetical protein IMZ64_09370, partial [Bacteroidetes bacterium]|nr:hypothetical protein [Bacteroidota bacterium]
YTFQIRFEKSLGHLRNSSHIVTKITEGTPAAGGWFVYIDAENVWGFHGNIFELVTI